VDLVLWLGTRRPRDVIRVPRYAPDPATADIGHIPTVIGRPLLFRFSASVLLAVHAPVRQRVAASPTGLVSVVLLVLATLHLPPATG
jgi:hypothetical protein